jgi:ribose transport system ATP-binding protein
VTELLAIDGLAKRFGGIAALEDVSLRLGAGSVLALCGANGAGKSTLVRILAGVETPDAGEIRIDGAPVTIGSPQDATRLGLNFIHQELNLVPKFTALQNMALGYEGAARRGLLDRRAARRRARAVVDRLGADFDLDAPVQDLTVSQRWMVSLGRSLMREGARVIAMDEPTASFTEAEAERLFSIISDLTADGVAVLYISHRLDEVLHVSHDVTVLRNGRVVGTFAADQIDRARLTREIVGQEVAELEAIPTTGAPVEARPVVLSARGLAREPRVRGVSLDVHAGEILGLAGLVGAGRTELARLLFGADAPTAGTMELEGRAFAPRSPYDAIRRGVALVPEERRSEGLLLQESVAFNITLATAKESRRGGLAAGLLSPGRARAIAREMVSRFGIKVASVDQPVGALSGGNQQKVVVSKYVRAAPKLLILDEPTVGVDVGARGELYAIIRDLAEAGAAVIIISSDFEELAICERVAVMREGRVTALVDAAHATKDHLTSLCYSEEEIAA